MGIIFPSLENIQRLKVPPTDGEWYLINYFIENLSESVEIYFQPFLNGDMPDIILVQKDAGVTIIEIKDWNLNLYSIDKNNRWYLTENGALLKSPFQQVFRYKANLFNLHIDGILEAKLKNKQFFGRINSYVYFHHATKQSLSNFFSNVLNEYKEIEKNLHESFKNKDISYDKYEKQLDYLKRKKLKIERDLNYHSIGNDNINKIHLPSIDSKIFTEDIYKEFQRYLQPPFHTIDQGIKIDYTKKQEKLSISKPIHQKIKGVAGSGKTVVLAKRAVNAYKRHKSRVLILTYNITLRSYIHEKISDVRKDFSWKYFYITNYHQLITQLFNNIGVEIEIPEDLAHNQVSIFLDENYYSNTKLFEQYKNEIPKYKSIFIDEIQDYKPEWIKIIRTYFLEENSEMVLFGDEKQNIYERGLDREKKPKIVKGFGEWEVLNKSIRHQGNGGRILDLAKRFQAVFFKDKYGIDTYEDTKNEPSLSLGIYKIKNYQNYQINEVVSTIIQEIRDYNIHPNDVAILCSNIELLKNIDYNIRKNYPAKTLTTFETLEMSKKFPQEIDNIRKRKKIGFNLNNGMMKLSTIHSFKGYEIPTLFLIIDEDDNEEIVYAGITRSKFNIMVFTKENSRYNDFFNIDLERVPDTLTK
ncbi:AAA family ATPase [Sulfurimonas sp.]